MLQCDMARPHNLNGGRPKKSPTIRTEEYRTKLRTALKTKKYEPIIRWIDRMEELEALADECAATGNHAAAIQYRRLIFDMDKEINSYTLTKLKPKDVDGEGDSAKNPVGVTVKLVDPFAREPVEIEDVKTV